MVWRSILLLALLPSALASVAGVSPDAAAQYEEGSTFYCDGGATAVPFERVNDDYCDCVDGKDEPGTSACSGTVQHAYFFCANAGYKADSLPQMRINDGICDCCDGTDEYANPAARCQDVCEEVAAVRAKEESEKAAKVAAGLAAKAELVKKAEEILSENEEEVARMRAELAEKLKRVEEAQAEKQIWEAVETEEREEIRKKSEAEKTKADEEHEARLAAREQEREEQRRMLADATTQHGMFAIGMQVRTIADINFLTNGLVPAGTVGRVTALEVADADSEDEVEGAANVGPGAPQATKPMRPVVAFDAQGFSFVAEELDVMPTGHIADPSGDCGESLPNACMRFTQTANCDPKGSKEDVKDCSKRVDKGISGLCECSETVRYEFTCDHPPMTCQATCENNGEPSESVAKPCPSKYPYPSQLNLCYESKEHAVAGTGPCGTWCARNKEWYDEHKCEWGCDCGKLCYPEVHVRESKAADPVLSEFKVDTGLSHTNADAVTARNAFNVATAEVSTLERQLKEKDASAGTNYGPDNVFLALKGQCFTLETDYVYKLCPFGDVHQGHTLMGKWGKWGQQTYGSWGGSDDLTVQHYENGQSCWSGPQRSVEVKIICGAENAISNVQEPSMCTYTMVWETPAACE